MTAATALPHPDLMIAIPGIRRQADQRWVVHLWRGEPCRAAFRHYDLGVIAMNHQAEWADGEWVEALPSQIPPRLKARAHRELRRLARHQEQVIDSPADRLVNSRARRRSLATGQRPRLWRP
jgi:hypothetical protein